MSVQSVLFDLPGPKARARHRMLAIVGGALIFALLGLFIWGLWPELTRDKWAPFLRPSTWTAYIVPGLIATVTSAAVSVVFSGVLGLILGVGRLSQSRAVSLVAGILVEFFRSVPVLMMMLFAYYLFVFSGILTGPTASFWGVVMGLTLYNASVIAELVRSGVHSLPRGQAEAGFAIGLTRGQTLNLVLLPQAIRAMLPALISQLIVVLKDTALGYIIIYPELLQSADRLAANFGNVIVAYLVIAVIFIVINFGLSGLAEWVENLVSRRQSTVITAVPEAVDLSAEASLQPFEGEKE